MGEDQHRTFAARPETRRGTISSMLPEPGEPTWVIHAEPLKTPQEGGGTRVSMGFPILVVSGWVGDAEKVAARIAEILTEAKL